MAENTEHFIQVVTQRRGEATVFARLMLTKSSKLTKGAYAADLRDFAQFLGLRENPSYHPFQLVPDTAWLTLTRDHVSAYLNYLKEFAKTPNGQPYSTATIARRMTAVRELLTEALYQGCFDREDLNYIRERIQTPAVTHEHHGGISPDEQQRLLHCADQQPGLKGLRDYTLFRLWLDTGVRREEMQSLQVRDLGIKNGIPRVIVRHGKGNRLREVGLESYTANVLLEWLELSGQTVDEYRPMFVQVRKQKRDGEPEARYRVVEPDKPLNVRAYNKLVDWYVRQANIVSKITPHSFRVAMVTDFLDGGASLPHVQNIGGWTSPRMITEVYDRNLYVDDAGGRYRKQSLPQRADRYEQMELGGEE